MTEIYLIRCVELGLTGLCTCKSCQYAVCAELLPIYSLIEQCQEVNNK